MKNKKSLTSKKRKFWTKKNIILLIISALVVSLVAILYLHYRQIRSAMLSEQDIYTFQNQIVNTTTIGEDVLIATDKGGVALLNPKGKIVWVGQTKSNVHSLEVSPDENYIAIGSSAFYVFDKNGKEIFEKKVDNYFPFKSKFLINKTIKLVYQSLLDLSYMAITVDYSGKTIASEKIPDLGENAYIDISQSGMILFAGERGEIFLIQNGKDFKDTSIDKKVSSIHNIFGQFVDGNSIVVGYKNSSDTNLQAPVYFFDLNLKLIKNITFSNNINSARISNGNIVFSTDDGFYVYSGTGILQGQKVQIGLSGFQFDSNDLYKMYVYYKKATGENEKPLVDIVITDKNDNSIGNYLYTFDSMPQMSLSEDGIIFLSEQQKLKVLRK